MSVLSLERVAVVFTTRDERQVEALKDVSLEIGQGEFLCLLGPSGCGKSTILNLLGGFIRPTAGTVLYDGRPVLGSDHDRGVVFQRHNLFPWHTIEGNVGFGLRIRGMPREERKEIVRHYLDKGGLLDFAKNYPEELSVGMQQRVALVRAFANDPAVLLMDEPFASLDTRTASRMRDLLRTILAERRKTVVFVTHDIDEAVELADRIVVLTTRPGSIKQEFRLDAIRSGDRLNVQASLDEMKRAIEACYT
ncbi:MAG: ABC transporter ATP-binding protein, partial [Blastocatellia bacterium]